MLKNCKIQLLENKRIAVGYSKFELFINIVFENPDWTGNALTLLLNGSS